MSVYTLVLEKNKYYVGFTNRTVEERFQEHLEDYGSRWTSLYKPLQILCIRPGDLRIENEVTLDMMRKYGWRNVRGGSWCKVDMEHPPIALQLEEETFLESLFNKFNFSDNDSENESDNYSESSWENLSDYKEKCCYRCGRTSHFIKDCYATTHIKGYCIKK